MKPTKIAVYALGGLMCAGIAPAAQAQFHHVTFNEVSDNGSTLFLPQFDQSNPRFKNATLVGLDVSTTADMFVYGTLTNNTSKTQYFKFKTDVIYTLNGPTFTSTAEPIYTIDFNKRPAGPGLPSGATYAFGSAASPVAKTGVGHSGFITSGLGAYTGNGTFAVNYSSAVYSGINRGKNNGMSDFITINQTTTSDINAKVTYYYFLPKTSVPELGTSISLGLMGLVGGAFGLRARRRK